MTRPWRKSEEAYLKESAGRVPMKEIAAHLKRSQGAVREHAREMRARGEDVACLRVYTPRTVMCPFCGKPRTRFDHDMCRVCKLERLIEKHKDTSYSLWLNLDPDYQARTLGNSAHRDSDIGTVLSFRKIPSPKRPDTSGMTAYQAAKANDEYLIALEAAEIDRLEHNFSALRVRENRWRKHQRKTL